MARRRPAEEDLLFDLPLDPAAAEPTPASLPDPPAIDQPPLPLDQARPPGPEPYAEELEAVIADSHREPQGPGHRHYTGEPTAAGLGPRAVAGLIDLGVCGVVAVMILVALLTQGVRPSLSDWPAGSVFLLTFSFLYSVLPLAFWGRTPGMVLAGLRSTSPEGQPMTFRQASFKWLGLVLTVALAALPLLLVLTGRSLSDMLSGTVTRRRQPAA
jgi:uncharacterized RDD family membrane protein YckC